MNAITVEMAKMFECPFKKTKCQVGDCMSWETKPVVAVGDHQQKTYNRVDAFLDNVNFELYIKRELEREFPNNLIMMHGPVKKSVDTVTVEFSLKTTVEGGHCKCIP